MASPQLSDVEIIQFIRSDDPQKRDAALKTLYLDAVVYSKIRQMTANFSYKTDPDDVLQEGIILMDESVRSGRFRRESSVRTFLIGICRNLVRNNAKKMDKITFREEFKDADMQKDKTEEPFEAEELSQHEIRRDEILRELLKELTPGCREALTMYYFKAYNLAKVAEERGLANVGQAKKAAHRCREQLRALISENPALMNYLKQGI